MYSKQVYKNLIYLLTLYGTSLSSPIDTGIQALKKNDATLSGYRALSPPIWPYTPPMKPTRPYAFESNFDMSKSDNTQSPKSSGSVSSLPNASQSKNSDSKISQSTINFISQNYDNNLDQSSEEKRKEKEEFVQVLRSLLWDADEEDNSINDEESQGRQFGPNYSQMGAGYQGNNLLAMQQQQNLLRWHGVLGRPMPQILKKQGVVGQAYRGFEEGCYKLACTLGINRLISQIGRMLG